MTDEKQLSRFKACLLGLAIGDALGMPFEGWSSERIRKTWRSRDFEKGNNSISGNLPEGSYTDDTKMAICITRSLIECGKVNPDDISEKFLEWYRSGDLRGIGLTTYRALINLSDGYSWRESGVRGEYAAGNGGAMRIAPIGLFYYNRLNELAEAVKLATIITHNNEEAIKGAEAVAYAVALSIQEKLNPKTIVKDTLKFIGYSSKVSKNLRRVDILLAEKTSPSEVPKILGNSGYVVETIASAFYYFLNTPEEYEESIVNAVLGGGDTDTIAAITGALSGAYNGLNKIPRRWLNKLENRQYLEKLAEKLYERTHLSTDI